jgi:hypothetical protein
MPASGGAGNDARDDDPGHGDGRKPVPQHAPAPLEITAAHDRGRCHRPRPLLTQVGEPAQFVSQFRHGHFLSALAALSRKAVSRR